MTEKNHDTGSYIKRHTGANTNMKDDVLVSLSSFMLRDSGYFYVQWSYLEHIFVMSSIDSLSWTRHLDSPFGAFNWIRLKSVKGSEFLISSAKRIHVYKFSNN